MLPGMADRELVGMLRNVSLFKDLSARDLDRLAGNLSERTFEPGHEIAVEGHEGVGFFVIESGEATVSVGGKEISKLGPGDHFGEFALIDRGRRTATVTATSELRCHGMTAWNFRPFVESHAEVAWPLLQTLVARLRDAEARASG
jgi:CRP/FNR family cyclic AMP-dependent transcriptional regulator